MEVATIAACVLTIAFAAATATASEIPAKKLFSQVPGPAPLAARTIGFYSRGCVAGAVALPADGAEWQVMRLSRNRYWGMPELVAYIEKLAKDTKTLDGWGGLLVGDLGLPRGGPLPFGHTSHQSGLDVDIWFEPMPDRQLSPGEREDKTMDSVLVSGTRYQIDMTKWPDGLDRVIKRAAGYPEVARIFVNPGVKKLLCDRAGDDRDWLRKIRPWYRHDDHFHVRLNCPSGSDACRDQDPPAPGDGCGEALDSWLKPTPQDKQAPKPTTPAAPPGEIMMSDLPADCSDILASGKTGLLDPPSPPLPRMRPVSMN